MRQILFAACAWALLSVSAGGAMPRPGQLLPDDTLFVLAVPDWETAVAEFNRSAIGRLWNDPAVKPVKENFLERFSSELAGPLEKELGILFSDYSELFRGQITFAVTRSGLGENSDGKAGVMLLIDTKEESERLQRLVTELRAKWVESEREIRSERIRDVEFSSLIVRGGDFSGLLSTVFQESGVSGQSAGNSGEDEFEITFGQSGSLLLIGNSVKEMEKVLIRQSGGLVPALEEHPDFQIIRSEGFQDAVGFGWVHFNSIYDLLVRQAESSASSAQASNPFAPRTDKILAATGLNALKSIAVRVNGMENGIFSELFLGVPRQSREGVFEALVAEAKDSGPPPFVPLDAVRFSRWRLDGRKAWESFESMLSKVSPELGALVQMGLATAGKGKDPNFDLRSSLFGNLGDDFIVYEKAPRSATLADLNSAPAVFLVGSPKAEQLALALKAGAALLPVALDDSGLSEREFLGRKVYSIPLPTLPSIGGAVPVKRSFSFAATGRYVVLSSDVAMLEEFIRTGDSGNRSLRDKDGLNQAAQRVGGMGTGFFGYENQRENVRVTLETFKNDLARIEKLLSGGSKGTSASVTEWLDFSLLPPFETISKYFHFLVYSGGAVPQGLAWRIFAPPPPESQP